MTDRSKSERPIAYKFGGAFFCEMPFYVTKHTLIPRYDTELLVETVIKNVRENSHVLDLCTGSGCIAVVLAKHKYKVTASDISKKALRVAKRNAKLHDVNIEFLQSNHFENIFCGFDAIVCNPPYIKTNEIGKYDPSILHEPRIALDGGVDGLDFYRILGDFSATILNDNGQIFFEIDHRAAKAVENILHENGFYDIKVIKDKQGLDRVIYARKN